MEIQCRFEYINWTHNPKLYTCFVTSATITEPNTEIKFFKGAHQLGKDNKNVQGIKFLNTDVRYFPRRLETIFPNLIAFDIENCGLRKVTRRDVKGLENLEDFSLYENELTSLSSDLFGGFHKLKMISLNDNKLEILSSQLLKPVLGNELIHVHLNNNKVIDAFYEPGKIGSVKTLRELMEIIDAKCGSAPDAAQGAGFNDLWTTGRHSDFVIIAESRKFRVHKLVLATRSPFFSNMFEKNNKSNEMKIEDLSTKTVEKFLQYIYTGEIAEESDDALELFAIANKYDVADLKAISMELVLENITDANAYKSLTFGNLYSSEEIKRAAFSKIKTMFPAVKLNDSLMNKPEELKILFDAKHNYESMLKKFQEMNP